MMKLIIDEIVHRRIKLIKKKNKHLITCLIKPLKVETCLITVHCTLP